MAHPDRLSLQKTTALAGIVLLRDREDKASRIFAYTLHETYAIHLIILALSQELPEPEIIAADDRRTAHDGRGRNSLNAPWQ